MSSDEAIELLKILRDDVGAMRPDYEAALNMGIVALGVCGDAVAIEECTPAELDELERLVDEERRE